VNELIQKWGPAANVYKLPNGSVMYTWWFDGGAVAMPIGNMALGRQCMQELAPNKRINSDCQFR